MDFTFTNLKWGDFTPGTQGGQVNWSFASQNRTFGNATTSYEAYIIRDEFKQLIRDAFQSWENVANIDFVEVADGTSTQFVLGYDSIDGPAMPGQSTILADAQQIAAPRSINPGEPPPTLFSVEGAIIRFDIAETWTVNKTAVGDFYSTAVHEIGHAIGLGHAGVNTVMSALASSVTDVAAGDIEGIQTLYGAAPGALQALFAANQDTAKGLAAAYETLQAGIPTEAGFIFLINSAVSSNFGAGAGVSFNQENIFINLVNNLVQGGDATAAARFNALATGTTLEGKVTSLYQAIIPASKQSVDGLAFVTRQDGLNFYQDVAAERGVAGTDGAAIVSLASLLKIAVTADYGIGNSVNDLIKAVAAGNAALPADGSILTMLEVADGIAFDADDAVALARLSDPSNQNAEYMYYEGAAAYQESTIASVLDTAVDWYDAV
jgi:hypothetical protein